MASEIFNKLLSRRGFFRVSHLAVLAAGTAAGWAATPLLRTPHTRLRPPGALPEDQFLASCIKCGQCLQVCPPQIVKLGDILEGYGTGAPYIVPRQGACILCAGLPCVLACPTGALEHSLTEGKDAHMGLAVLSKPETCLAMLGQECTLCLDKCPIKDQNPIEFITRTDASGNTIREPVVQKSCVGCGVCEEVCPTTPASITITPWLKWRGSAA